jgi:ABC-2 type transport system permease protein
MSFSTLREYWRTVGMVAEVSIHTAFSDGFIVFTILFQPIIIAVLALWMLQDKGEEYAMFVVVGSGLTGLWSSLLFISGNSINAERWMGTLESLVGMPTPFEVIVFGKNLANVVQSLISMIIGYMVAALLFGYSLNVQEPLLFGASILLTILAFICFGLIIAPVFVMNPGVRAWQNAMEFPVYVLCGFLFPIALLPGWTSPVSYLLPPYWAARALHGASTGGAPASEIYFAWAMLLLFSIIDLAIAGKLFELMLFKARSDGTLDME